LTAKYPTNHINKKIDQFNQIHGEKKMKVAKHNITQEIRLRKLNRIETDNNQENLF
jgi:hypothetical protein